MTSVRDAELQVFSKKMQAHNEILVDVLVCRLVDCMRRRTKDFLFL